MISLYSGTPGSGKSLHVAQKILVRLNYLHLPVIANFSINLDLVKSSYKKNFFFINNEILCPELLIDFSRAYFKDKKVKEEEILLVIDECQLLFNCREWSGCSRESWVSFFTQHRKFGYHIILVAQFDRMIDRQIRSVIEYEFIHRKMSNFGIKGKIVALFFAGKLFIAVQKWYPLREKCGQEFFLYHKKNSLLYNSYMEFKKPKEKIEYDYYDFSKVFDI